MMRAATTPEERASVITYLSGRLGIMPQSLIGSMPFQAAVIARNGVPLGAVLYTNFRQHSIEMIAAGEPGWISRGDVRAVFAYPFLELGVWTVLTMVNRVNTTSRELQRRLGFTELCVVATSAHKVEDIIVYGMSRDKCQWLNGPARLQEVA